MGHPGLVGLPLFLIMIFCFALVMANPNYRGDNAKSASVGGVSEKPASSLNAEPKAKKKPSSTNHAKVATPAPTPYQLSVTKGNGVAPTNTGTPQPNGPTPQAAQQNQGRNSMDKAIENAKKFLP
ncbi:MAG TPA: hypothetical protein VFX84_02580 [Candidatus Saccharimonadales bacterium]|nr:hypothetical protein [Candidatus Saccharimonadales bacterium]